MDSIRLVQPVTGPTLTISLPPEFAGQQVEVQIRVVPRSAPWGEGLQRCAGVLANVWTEDDERILEEIHRDRKRTSRREISQ